MLNSIMTFKRVLKFYFNVFDDDKKNYLYSRLFFLVEILLRNKAYSNYFNKLAFLLLNNC